MFSVISLWFYLLLASLWAGLWATSNGPTNQFTTLLLLPIFIAASLEFYRNKPKTKWDRVFGSTAYVLIVAWMLRNIYDLLILIFLF